MTGVGCRFSVALRAHRANLNSVGGRIRVLPGALTHYLMLSNMSQFFKGLIRRFYKSCVTVVNNKNVLHFTVFSDYHSCRKSF